MRGLLLLLAIPLLGVGCIDFSVDGYCTQNPALCAVAVYRVEPVAGPQWGNTRVSLYGLGFEADTTVEIGGQPVVDLRVSGIEALQFTTPAHLPERVDIIVRSQGTTFVANGAFEYAHPPELLEVTPSQTSSEGGRPLTVSVGHLTPTARVFVNDKEVPTSREADRVTLVAPSGPVGPASIRVENEFGASAREDAFRYVRPWEYRSAGLPPTADVWRLVVHPTQPDRVLALTTQGLFRTVDGGRSWTPVRSSALPDLREVVFAPSQPSRLYAATSQGVARSDDGGETWQQVGPAEEVFSVAVDPASADRLLAGGRGRLWTSVDGLANAEVHLFVGKEESPVGGVAVTSASDDTWVAALDQDFWVRTPSIPWSRSGDSPPSEISRLRWDPTSRLLSAEGRYSSSVSSTFGDRWDAYWQAYRPAIATLAQEEQPWVFVGTRDSLYRCRYPIADCADVGKGLAMVVFSVALAPSDPAIAYVGSNLGQVKRTEIAIW